MEIRLNYSATSKENGRFLFEDEVSVRVSKQEAFRICQNYFVYEYPSLSSEIATVLERGQRKARNKIYQERALMRNEYELEIEYADDQSDLFTDAFIKEFFKWLLKNAYNIGCTLYNDSGLYQFVYHAKAFFFEYYSGNLRNDVIKIQKRIMRQ